VWKGFEFLRPAVEARPIRAPVADPHRISLIDIDGLRLGLIARQVPVRPALGVLPWNPLKSRYYTSKLRTRLDKTVLGGLWTQWENRLATDSPLEGDGFEPLVCARELRSPAARQSPFCVAMLRAGLLTFEPLCRVLPISRVDLSSKANVCHRLISSVRSSSLGNS